LLMSAVPSGCRSLSQQHPLARAGGHPPGPHITGGA
jgi:hypothetical protein